MIEELGGITANIAKLALDAALVRHQVIANNIANIDTHGYVPKRLDFSQYMAGLSLDPAKGSDAQQKSQLGAAREALQDGSAIRERVGDSVEMDDEVVKMTANVLQYRAILEALGKRGAIVKMAVSEGRR